MWQNNNYWNDVRVNNSTSGEILIENKNINTFSRDEILKDLILLHLTLSYLKN